MQKRRITGKEWRQILLMKYLAGSRTNGERGSRRNALIIIRMEKREREREREIAALWIGE